MSIPPTSMNFRRRVQSLSFKFLSESLEYTILNFTKQEQNLLIPYFLRLLSTLSDNLIDGMNDCDLRIFEIWGFIVYLNYEHGIFDRVETFGGLQLFLKETPCFHAAFLVPRKRSLVKSLLVNLQISQKFELWLKDMCKFVLDDPRGYIVSSLETDECLHLLMIFQQQFLKFQFSLEDNLASYLYSFYVKPTGNLSFDLVYKSLQKVFELFVLTFNFSFLGLNYLL